MDYAYLCTNLGHLMGLQVRIFREKNMICNYNNVEFYPDIAELVMEKIKSSPNNVDYFDTAKPLFFGSIKIIKKKITIVIGPAFSIKPGKEQLRSLLRELGISLDRLNEFCFYIDNIPTYSIESFLQITCFINYYLNKEKLTVSDILTHGTPPQTPRVSTNEREDYDSTDDVKIHNTYVMENELLSYITGGKTELLKSMFGAPPTGRVGKLAHDELRQKRNTFICSATLASRAAITGGLSHEVAFTMSDYYIQKVELLTDYNALTRLNMDMLLEFAKRVEELKFSGSNSKYVVSAVRYINKNLNGRITLDDISSHLGISRTYLCELFKSETGETINTFITRLKIEEAKRLLGLTDRSIVSISESLNFSSQCYFQNIFKKQTGKTPNQFRTESAKSR